VEILHLPVSLTKLLKQNTSLESRIKLLLSNPLSAKTRNFAFTNTKAVILYVTLLTFITNSYFTITKLPENP